MARQTHFADIEAASANARGQNTIERGQNGEARAVAYLLRAGMRIVERNFRSKLGELDIVARDRGTLVFVEVRSRADSMHGNAVEMVNIHKQRKVTRVAWSYIATRRPHFITARFDVIGITGDDIVHIRDAWRLGDGK
jgi:putative endonuclease